MENEWGLGILPLAKRGWASKRDACQEQSTASESVDSQMRCLLRMNDSSHEVGNVITSAMLAQSDGQAGELLLDIQKQCLLSVNDTLQASINPTRHRTLEPQVKAHFSPSRAVVSCDFQGAICKKKTHFDTRLARMGDT